jgi:hypothetical protein
LYSVTSDGKEFLLLWPDGYSYANASVIDDAGTRVVGVGDSLSGLGGGVVGEAVARDLVPDLNDACAKGHYMIVAA